MIYKFIDNNGSEITVNSLSSLQALADSDTINENTKVKAGLRGKWTTASKIEGLVFSTEEIKEDNVRMGYINDEIVQAQVVDEVATLKEQIQLLKLQKELKQLQKDAETEEPTHERQVSISGDFSY